MKLVLLHGFTGDPSSWDELRAQAGDADCPALLGHGDRDQSVSTFDGEVDRLAKRIEPGTHLVGYSLGARVALGLLVRHPDRFTGATLIGVSPGLEREEDRRERVRADAEWIAILEQQGIERFVDAWESQPLFATQSAAQRTAERLRRLRHDPSELARALRVLGLGAMPNLWPALPSLRVPIHLVAGEHDTKFRAIAERMLALLPNARLTIAPGCGHNVPLELKEGHTLFLDTLFLEKGHTPLPLLLPRAALAQPRERVCVPICSALAQPRERVCVPICSAGVVGLERGLILTLEDADGRRGLGEASPLPRYSRETLPDCRAALDAVRWQEIGGIEELAIGPAAAQFAAETAVLELIAQQQARSIADLLGQQRDRVPLAALIEEGFELDRIEAALARGIRTVKLKVGRDLSRELALVESIRKRFGERIALRLDANRRWSIEEAREALNALVPFAPELVEEPCADWDAIDPVVPLALDESLQEMSFERIRALAKKAAALVLKPMALGGFARCLALARLAQELGLSCVVTHLMDGPIAVAAASELALALPGNVLACGLDRHGNFGKSEIGARA